MTDMETPPLPSDSSYYTVMIHFYRGELGRIMIWRQRLDVTTNWAIVGSTGMITFGLGSPRNSPMIFLLANLLTFLLMMIEARRYRYYDAFRARVRMLESHFIMPMMNREANILQSDWQRLLSEDLVTPTFKISPLDALTRRFMRNYVWIFLVILGGWIMKLLIHVPDAASLPERFGAQFVEQPLRATLFALVVAAFYGYMIYLTVRVYRMEYNSGEFLTKSMYRGRWLK